MLLVESASRLALAGLGVLVVTLLGRVHLVVDVVLGRAWAGATGVSMMVLFAVLWVLVPIVLVRSGRFPQNPAPDAQLACGRPSGARALSAGDRSPPTPRRARHL